jgi:membrane protein
VPDHRKLPPGAKPLVDVPDLSPEARRKEALRWRAGLRERAQRHLGRGARIWEVTKRVWVGVYNDGFIHAGNLAYMVILSLFPFFVVGAAVFQLIGEPQDRATAIAAVLTAMPREIAATLRPVAYSVIEARSGWLLWAGGLVGLWTVSSLVETLRDILRRAYGTHWEHAFWRYRLASTGVIMVAMVLLIASLAVQVLLAAIQQAMEVWTPQLADAIHSLGLAQWIPAFVLYGSLYLLFLSLTPSTYRDRCYPKWPGALFVTLWWVAVTLSLPPLLHRFFAYDLTYGSLAGVMIALFFFWLVGLGMVVGAELNAALAETPEEQDMLGQADNRAKVADAAGNNEKGGA